MTWTIQCTNSLQEHNLLISWGVSVLTIAWLCYHNYITLVHKKIIIIITFHNSFPADTQSHTATNGSVQWCPLPRTCAIQRGNSRRLLLGSLLCTASHCMSWRSTWGSNSQSSEPHVAGSGSHGLHSACSSWKKVNGEYTAISIICKKKFICIYVFIFKQKVICHVWHISRYKEI